MNRREFFSSVAAVGVSTLVPSTSFAIPVAKTIDDLLSARKRIAELEEKVLVGEHVGVANEVRRRLNFSSPLRMHFQEMRSNLFHKSKEVDGWTLHNAHPSTCGVCLVGGDVKLPTFELATTDSFQSNPLEMLDRITTEMKRQEQFVFDKLGSLTGRSGTTLAMLGYFFVRQEITILPHSYRKVVCYEEIGVFQYNTYVTSASEWRLSSPTLKGDPQNMRRAF